MATQLRNALQLVSNIPVLRGATSRHGRCCRMRKAGSRGGEAAPVPNRGRRTRRGVGSRLVSGPEQRGCPGPDCADSTLRRPCAAQAPSFGGAFGAGTVGAHLPATAPNPRAFKTAASKASQPPGLRIPPALRLRLQASDRKVSPPPISTAPFPNRGRLSQIIRVAEEEKGEGKGALRPPSTPGLCSGRCTGGSEVLLGLRPRGC
jgi:hypothetical protein